MLSRRRPRQSQNHLLPIRTVNLIITTLHIPTCLHLPITASIHLTEEDTLFLLPIRSIRIIKETIQATTATWPHRLCQLLTISYITLLSH
jgi:hypothetical protein